MGRAKRYIITVTDDDQAPLDKLCQKLIVAGATCEVMRNPVVQNQSFAARCSASRSLAAK